MIIFMLYKLLPSYCFKDSTKFINKRYRNSSYLDHVKNKMHNNSDINSPSPKKSKTQRAQSSILSDSFRMADSVLGSKSTSNKAYTIKILST